MDLESVAAELSQVPPATFVTRRAELAKAGREEATGAATQTGASAAEAKAAGRQLADAIKKLGKPSSAAWAVNLLQAQRPHELDAVVELGAEFRAAVAAGDAARLTALSAERRTTLRRVTGAAVELAERALLAPVVAVDDDGRVPEPPSLSPAVSADVEQTLQAVLADPAAEAAVRTGRLVRMLTSNGVEAVDLTDAVSGPFIPPEPDDDEPEDDGAEDDAGGDDAGDGDAERTRSVRSHSSSSSSKSKSKSKSDKSSDSHSDDKRSDSESAANRAAREAARALDDLDHQLDELRELRRRAREQSDRLGDEIADLEARLADLTAELDDRRADRERLEDRLDETDRQFGRLDRERDRAARLAETTARAARR